MLFEAYIDHQRIGCGYRQFLLLKSGPKWTRVLVVGDMTILKLPTSRWRAARPTPVAVKPSRLRARVKENGRVYRARPSLIREALTAARSAP